MRRITKSKFLILALVLLWCIGCASNLKTDLKNGDLLFVTAKSSGLSGAINEVTKTNEQQQYDHVGMVELEGFEPFVLHAAPKGGAQRQKLADFIRDQKNEGQVVVQYRLKDSNPVMIQDAILEAKRMLGKPYNFDYILNDNSYYCSDFIERAFRKYEVFKLEPMTFKDPKTGETNSFWKEFYKKKNLEVPEGELGCNPNGLAASEKLMKINILN